MPGNPDLPLLAVGGESQGVILNIYVAGFLSGLK
jgi:hypothetical protein